MPSDSKPSLTPDSLPTKGGTKPRKAPPMGCTICDWLTKLQEGTRKEMLKHLSKFHPPVK